MKNVMIVSLLSLGLLTVGTVKTARLSQIKKRSDTEQILKTRRGSENDSISLTELQKRQRNMANSKSILLENPKDPKKKVPLKQDPKKKVPVKQAPKSKNINDNKQTLSGVEIKDAELQRVDFETSAVNKYDNAKKERITAYDAEFKQAINNGMPRNQAMEVGLKAGNKALEKSLKNNTTGEEREFLKIIL
jgi:hypothetical protein